MVYTPYCYFIGWSKESKYYYGARWAKKDKCLYETGCHPDDFWVTYHTTSNHVKEMVDKFGQPDIIQIRKTFTTADEAINHEKKVLKRLRVLEKTTWLNENESTGRGVASHSASTKKKISNSHKGQKRSEETCKAISEALKGRKLSDKHRANLSKAQKGAKSHRYQAFILTATLPTGEVETYTFNKNPQQDCRDRFGLGGLVIGKMRKGVVHVIKIRSEKTKHHWKVGTKLSITLL